MAVGHSNATAPTFTLVQLPNGQTVQVHGVIQAAQPSVIQSPQVQTVQVRQLKTSISLDIDEYRLHFISILVQKDMMWKAVENVKLFYYCWTLATVLRFFSQEQGVIFIFVFYSINIKGIVYP